MMASIHSLLRTLQLSFALGAAVSFIITPPVMKAAASAPQDRERDRDRDRDRNRDRDRDRDRDRGDDDDDEPDPRRRHPRIDRLDGNGIASKPLPPITIERTRLPKKNNDNDDRDRDRDQDRDRDRDNDRNDERDRNVAKLQGAAPLTAAATADVDPQRLKLLVLAVDGTEPSYGAVTTFLDQIGIPFETFKTVDHLKNGVPLPTLNTGATTAHYQGIILTVGNLAYCDPATGQCQSTLSANDWATIDTFTQTFKIRTLSYYAWPEPRYGLVYAGVSASPGSSNPVNVKLASGQTLATSTFSYMKPNATVPVANSYMYFANTYADPGETTVPVLTASYSGQTYTVAAIHTSNTGQYLTVTMDHNPFLLHSLAFNYGLINWVTKGLFIGGRKIYLSAQVDDLFIPNDLFDRSQPACVPSAFAGDPTVNLSESCPTYRITGNDLQAFANWQDTQRSVSQTAAFKVSMAFNGLGTTTAGGAPRNDTLLSKSKALASKFFWISHTYNHENLDCYNAVPNSGVCPSATQAQSASEIGQNVSVANANNLLLGSNFDAISMITPEVSGLYNSNFVAAAYGAGLRYLIGDASKPDQKPSSANVGIPNQSNSNVLIVPRYATNIFYNTTVPNVNVAGSQVDEYNHFYGPDGISRQWNGAPWFTTNQTYAQITETEGGNLFANMLRYSVFPSMFHQGNLKNYGSGKSLVSDVLGKAINKFTALSNLPIISLNEAGIGAVLKERAAANASGVFADWTPATTPGGQGTVMLMVNAPATITVTGICAPAPATCETYGGQKISRIPMTPGNPVYVASPF